MASTGSGAVMGTCLYCVILFVSADKLHLDNPQLVRHGDDQPIVIAFDVENNPAVLHLALRRGSRYREISLGTDRGQGLLCQAGSQQDVDMGGFLRCVALSAAFNQYSHTELAILLFLLASPWGFEPQLPP